jgi:hypothetical protein
MKNPKGLSFIAAEKCVRWRKSEMQMGQNRFCELLIFLMAPPGQILGGPQQHTRCRAEFGPFYLLKIFAPVGDKSRTALLQRFAEEKTFLRIPLETTWGFIFNAQEILRLGEKPIISNF